MEEKNEDILSNISITEEIETDNITNYELLNNGYTCDKCNSIPEIKNIDYINNTILIKCSNHESQISINDYINDTLKHNFYFSVCNICKKNIQKENNNIFKYCYNCNKIICIECTLIHDKSHKLINLNDYNNKCVEHFNQKYTSFCYNCDKNICNECKKTKIHKDHKKNDFIEIEPTKNDIEQINNFSSKFRKSFNSLKISGKKEIEELENNKKNLLQIIQLIFNKQYNKNLKEAENNFNYNLEVYERKKNILDVKYKEDLNKLNEEFKKINLQNELEKNKRLESCKKSYLEKKDIIESNYNLQINKCLKYNRELKKKYNDIIRLNEIIINSYYNNKNQYHYI